MANLVACQLVSSPDVSVNLQHVEQYIAQQQPGDLIVLPECFACFGAGDAALLLIAEELGEGAIQEALSAMAKKYKVWLVAGTMPITTSKSGKYTATCLIFDDTGRRVDDYQKIHLFDVQVEDGTRNYLESKYTQAGDKLVVVDSPFGKIGVAVCYDIRFAAMFVAMGEIDVLVLPSAFTRATGRAHWEPLLKARAIEKQCYLVAANQGGIHANGRETYGHSCVISPWGEILSEIETGSGAVSAKFDPSEISRIRTNMPVQQHNQFRSYLV
ncbi:MULTISPECIES: carbon-nitrogen hydrolase family protein [Alteromonadaceae]|uniref:carbon-nitrogen hydrolase family protein n=1 Tax=Alteromonadaceae TaxID=72275 RepID=UPI001C082EC1|nr:carbon-nitrogen hydrolase family protein [Aliiglaciecola lipolytica]MBU2880192.1 carbon-nitrogen hydrolase family protein [Aliiglaciecola lipolytica]